MTAITLTREEFEKINFLLREINTIQKLNKVFDSEAIDLFKFKILAHLNIEDAPSQKLDCPYDFTSRCTMGSCDCKPKQETTSSQTEISDDRTKLHWKTSLVIHTPEISDEEYYKDVFYIYASKAAIVESHILFAKWMQEKMYSEEDMKEAIMFGVNGLYGWQMGEEGYTDNQIKRFLEQLKTKQ